VQNLTQTLAWLSVIGSVLLLTGYEWRAHRLGKKHPERLSRYANARVRTQWVWALASQPGFEIVAVQTLRNSLMSATIAASTAALTVMGVVSIAGARLASELPEIAIDGAIPLRILIEALLVLVLFASYVCSAMAMRHFGHAGFVMSMPAASPERKALNSAAAHHVRRAGLLYSWGLRLFLFMAPMVAGIVHPYAMTPVTLLLLVALHFFDQPAQLAAE